jgi:hypothetical protein
LWGPSTKKRMMKGGGGEYGTGARAVSSAGVEYEDAGQRCCGICYRLASGFLWVFTLFVMPAVLFGQIWVDVASQCTVPFGTNLLALPAVFIGFKFACLVSLLACAADSGFADAGRNWMSRLWLGDVVCACVSAAVGAETINHCASLAVSGAYDAKAVGVSGLALAVTAVVLGVTAVELIQTMCRMYNEAHAPVTHPRKSNSIHLTRQDMDYDDEEEEDADARLAHAHSHSTISNV